MGCWDEVKAGEMSEQKAVRMGCWDEVKAGDTSEQKRQCAWLAGMRSRLETGVSRMQPVWLV